MGMLGKYREECGKIRKVTPAGSIAVLRAGYLVGPTVCRPTFLGREVAPQSEMHNRDINGGGRLRRTESYKVTPRNNATSGTSLG